MKGNLRNVKSRSHQEVDEKGKVKSKRGGWAQKDMVPINRKIKKSLKNRIEQCVRSENTIYNTETDFLRLALERLLKREGF